REPWQGRIGQQRTHVRERDTEREQERPREVQVVRRLDHLVAEQGDEFTRLQGEAAAERELIRAVRFLQVEVRRVPKRELVVVAPEDSERVVLLRVVRGPRNARREDEAIAERVLLRRVLLDAELGHVERVPA